MPRLLTQVGADPDRLSKALEAGLGPTPPGQRARRGARPGRRHPAAVPAARRRRAGGRPAEGRVRLGRASCPGAARRKARRQAPGELLQRGGRDPGPRSCRRSPAIRGNQRVTSATPEVAYEALEKYGRDLVADAAGRQARPGDRPGRGDPPGDPDPVPQDQEQPGADRRSRRRQDGDRRGPGPAHHPRRRARGAARQDHLRPRHGLAGRRGEVPRRVRGAAQGGAQRGQGGGGADPAVHRRAAHRRRRRARPRGPWTPGTCSSRCSPAASCT